MQDEVFWQQQQKRQERRLGQPCCTQSGISWSMIDMPGRFSVVVHGEKDCLNCFHHHTVQSARKFFSTRLSDAQLTMGTSEEVLGRCLRLIVQQEKPDVILVLGTCPVEVIGANFTETVEEMMKETGTLMIPLRTSGLKLSSQKDMLDWLYYTLATLDIDVPDLPCKQPSMRIFALLWRRTFQIELPKPAKSTGVVINLIGFPPMKHPEIRWMCSQIGIDVHASFPVGATLTEWYQMRLAQHSFVVDMELFPRLFQALRDFGQNLHEVPIPIGWNASRTCFLKIAEVCGRTEQAHVLLEKIAAPIQKRMHSYKEMFANKRVALVTRMRNSYRIDSISRHGLGVYDAFLELGMSITVLIQGAPDPQVEASYKKQLQESDIDVPIAIFDSPFSLTQLLRQQKFDMICVNDQGRISAQKAGIPHVDSGAIEGGFYALFRNWEIIARSLAGGM